MSGSIEALYDDLSTDEEERNLLASLYSGKKKKKKSACKKRKLVKNKRGDDAAEVEVDVAVAVAVALTPSKSYSIDLTEEPQATPINCQPVFNTPASIVVVGDSEDDREMHSTMTAAISATELSVTATLKFQTELISPMSDRQTMTTPVHYQSANFSRLDNEGGVSMIPPSLERVYHSESNEAPLQSFTTLTHAHSYNDPMMSIAESPSSPAKSPSRTNDSLYLYNKKADAVSVRDGLKAKQQKKEEAKRLREQSKREQQQKKKSSLLTQQHKNGKFSHEEIFVAMEKTFHDSSLGKKLVLALKEASYQGKATPFHVGDPVVYSIHGTIRWLWRSYFLGGASGQSFPSNPNPILPPEVIPVTAIYCDGSEFIAALMRDGCTTFVEYASRIRNTLMKSSGRVFFVVEGIDKAIVKIYKQNPKKRSQKSIKQMVNDAIIQLYVDEMCQVKLTMDEEDTIGYLVTVTRELSMVPYKEKEGFLDFVQRKTSFRVGARGESVGELSSKWLHMLQMIPGISEARAQSIMNHFPTLRSLMDAYHNPLLSVSDKKLLLADKFSNLHEALLSTRVYRVFCSSDPNELV